MVRNFKKIVKGDIFNRVFKLSSLSVISIIITLSVTPLLTRYYGSDSFGEYGVYISWMNILTVVMSLRYEVAIVPQENVRDAKSLFFSSLVISVALLIIFLLISLIASPVDVKWPFLIVILAFFANVGAVARNFLNRAKRTNTIGYANILRSSFTNGFQSIGIAVNALGHTFLVWSRLISEFLTSAYLLIRTRNNFFVLTKEFKRNFIDLTKANKDFPLFTMPAALLNKSRGELPVILLAAYYDPTITGYYVITKRLFTPIGFLTSSMKLIFYQKFSTNLKSNRAVTLLYGFPLTVVLLLIIPCGIFYFYGPQMIEVYLGENWIDSFEYMLYLIPGLIAAKAVGTVGDAQFSLSKNRFGLLWSIVFFAGLFAVFHLLRNYDNEKLIFLGISILQIIMYSIYMVFIHFFILKKNVNISNSTY